VKVKAWLPAYLASAWVGHFCQGLGIGILGPTQPYLAAQVGVPNSQISFIWTGRAIGNCLAAILASFIFSQYTRIPWQKLAFLGSCLFVSGAFGFLVPFVSNFYLILPVLLATGITIGSFNTANNSLVIYMMGPKRSPPYIQSLHAFNSAGIVFVSLLVRPFFPSGKGSCGLTEEANSTVLLQSPLEYSNRTILDGSEPAAVSDEVPSLAWPFIICSAIHLLPALGFLLMVIAGLPMPIYNDGKNPEDPKTSRESTQPDTKNLVKHPKILLFCGLFFCLFSCGVESSFHSQVFTFALCGPHQLSPQQAASLTTTFAVAFLAGRFSGIALSRYLSPAIIILATNIGCVVGTLLLAVCAGWVLEVLFIGTAIVGFSTSMQVASGYSWLASKVDLTGNGNSFIFLGTNLGWLIFPPIAGLVIFSGPGGVGVFLLAFGTSVAQTGVIGFMMKMASLKNNSPH